MLKSTYKRLLRVFKNLERAELLTSQNRNHYSLHILNSFIKVEKYFPITTYSISPTALLHILNYISTYKPKNIVEFGSGLTTIYISKLLKTNQIDSSFFSVDSDANWIEVVKNSMETSVKFVHAPLSAPFSFNNHLFNWYDTTILDKTFDKEDIDLVIIDAPLGSVPYSRAGAFLYFKDQIAGHRLSYFFDDTNRKEEREILQQLGADYVSFYDYSVGGKKMPYEITPLVYAK